MSLASQEINVVFWGWRCQSLSSPGPWLARVPKLCVPSYHTLSPAALYSESWVTSNVTLGCKTSTPEQNRKPIYVKLKAIFLVHHLLPSSKWNTFCQNYRLPLHPALGHRIYLCTTKGNKHYRKIMTFKAAGTLPNTSYMCVHRWKWMAVYPQGPIRKMQSPLQ